jgi:hypothetical protein
MRDAVPGKSILWLGGGSGDDSRGAKFGEYVQLLLIAGCTGLADRLYGTTRSFSISKQDCPRSTVGSAERLTAEREHMAGEV